MTKQEKINAIIDAARNRNFSDSIEEIELLEYFYTDENGDESTYEDRFDFIDLTTCPVSVWFICCTGYDNLSVPITKLTNGSINRLFDCINK